MSTSQATTPRRISSILLAMRQMCQLTSPDKILHDLKDPIPSDDYDHLDALATLCSFASAQCDSVIAAVEQCAESNHLYLVASPSAPPPLRGLLPAWIDLIQKLPVRSAGLSSASEPYLNPDSESDFESELDVDSELDSDSTEPDADGSLDRDYTVPEQTFIIAVYRACYAKLLDAANRNNDGQELLHEISEISPRLSRLLDITGSPLVASVELLVGMGGKESPLSAEDLLRLHCAAGVVAQFKTTFPAPIRRFLLDADRLSYAVDTLVEFATSSDYKASIDLPWNVVWIDNGIPGSAPNFLVTMNTHELARIVGKEELNKEPESIHWAPFDPTGLAGDVRMVEGSPDHFTGNGVVHCESALLHYIVHNKLHLSVAPYIGCSHPTCYACVMLVRACNRQFSMNVNLGCRRADLEELDITWSYPALGPAVYKRLANGIMQDFEQLCTQPHYTTWRPILTNASDLTAFLQNLGLERD